LLSAVRFETALANGHVFAGYIAEISDLLPILSVAGHNGMRPDRCRLGIEMKTWRWCYILLP
jgi:hypothetical protein